jgi:hypothetical protein
LSARIAPPDLDRVKTAFQATRTTPGPYQIDFRILRPDGIRWVSARGWGADEGIVGRIMFGVFLDSTARKAADGAREMLAGDTLGNHDMVLVYETPDDDVAARFSLMLNCLGAVRTKTMKAFPEGAYRQIVASLQ